jgi:hypothetical protein
MILDPDGGMAASTPGEVPVYIVCTDKSGYGFSLTRFPDELLIAVMVEDQTHYSTREVTAKLYRDKLLVSLSPSAAKELDGTTEYVIPLSASDEDMARVDSALKAIFSGVGHYERQF